MTSRGQPERRTGPAGAVPGSGDRGLVLAERGLGRAPPGEIGVPDRLRRGRLVVEEGGDDRAGLRDLLLPVAGGEDGVVLGGPDREPVRFPPGPGVQPGHPGSVGQPAAAGAVREGQGDARFHPRDDVPARVQDRGDQVMAGEVAVEADDEPGEQLRAAPHQALQQGLLPG